MDWYRDIIILEISEFRTVAADRFTNEQEVAGGCIRT
jgi:hypothetical protein